MIDGELKQYMLPNHISEGTVKANPKIHKQNNQFRTIISSINHLIEKMTEAAEHELDTWVKQLPTNIQDTTDFLRYIDDMFGIRTDTEEELKEFKKNANRVTASS